ncbi:MAG: LamG domain-containing protein [Melioribacteraceae bacterium]|nr:LamG domain-containing protein [Melioribacteraceae bacterium]
MRVPVLGRKKGFSLKDIPGLAFLSVPSWQILDNKKGRITLGENLVENGDFSDFTFEDNQITDYSGNGYDLAMQNSMEADQPTNGFSFEYDGVADFADFGDVPLGHPLQLYGSAFTIFAWVKTDFSTSFGRIVDKSNGKGGAGGYALFVKDDGTIYFTANNAWSHKSTTKLVANEWSFVVARNDGVGSTDISINNVDAGDDGSRIFDVPPNTVAKFRIGARYDGGNPFIDKIGVVGVAKIYLNDSIVTKIYEEGLKVLQKLGEI